MHTNSHEKVFYMKNHLLEKLHPNLVGGTPLNIFKIPKKPNRKKFTGLSRSRGKKIQKKGFEFFLIFSLQKMIRNMTGKFEIFFKISS